MLHKIAKNALVILTSQKRFAALKLIRWQGNRGIKHYHIKYLFNIYTVEIHFITNLS